MSVLLYPEIFETLPFGRTGADVFQDYLTSTHTQTTESGDVTVLIRARNEAGKLESLLDDIHQQHFAGDVQIVVVDTESTDGTASVARREGAEVVTISQADFSYPLSLNRGFAAAAYNNVYSTVGHARLTSSYQLQAVVDTMGERAAGAFGFTIPNDDATKYDKLVFLGQRPLLGKVTQIEKVGMGVMGANCAVFSREAWQELGGFDNRYEAGGEDVELAGRMLQAGFGIVRDPALSVHHSHGLGFMNTVKQYRHWQQILKGPQALDKQALAQRRPDLSI